MNQIENQDPQRTVNLLLNSTDGICMHNISVNLLPIEDGNSHLCCTYVHKIINIYISSEHQILICPVDSAIHLLNNWDQELNTGN